MYVKKSRFLGQIHLKCKHIGYGVSQSVYGVCGRQLCFTSNAMAAARRLFFQEHPKASHSFYRKKFTSVPFWLEKSFQYTAGIDFSDRKMKKKLDQKWYGGAVLMNLSKAFDTLNHDLLLAKLRAYGFLSFSQLFK